MGNVRFNKSLIYTVLNIFQKIKKEKFEDAQMKLKKFYKKTFSEKIYPTNSKKILTNC